MDDIQGFGQPGLPIVSLLNPHFHLLLVTGTPLAGLSISPTYDCNVGLLGVTNQTTAEVSLVSFAAAPPVRS